jgi:hypothetical protein
MPKQVKDLDVLRKYLEGVLERADHHAKSVEEIVLAIAGAVVWRKGVEPLEVMEREGDMKNVMWVRISGTRYALSYNHLDGAIELRENSTRGDVLGSFTNATPASEVLSFFKNL